MLPSCTRSNLVRVFSLFLFSLAGCSSSFHGIKFRAQSPLKEEAFRKLSLAISVDSYEIEKIDPENMQLLTKWRPSKENERSEKEKKSGGASLVRIDLRMESRGTLYDIFLTPMIQSVEGEQRIAEIGHPLRDKWKRIIGEIVQKETKEEG